MQTTFQIIIPTYNNLDELNACLKGFEKQIFTDFEVLICVDGSTDGTDSFLKNYQPGYPLRVLHHEDGKNHGRNPARNLGLRFLDAKYVVLLDSDLSPNEYFLQKHLDQLEKQPCISVGAVNYSNINTNIWARYQQTRGKNRFANGEIIPDRYFGIQNAAMKTNILVDSGGFDTQMVHYGGNDNELAIRVRENYDLPFIYNLDALAAGAMNKDINQAFLQLYEFGQHNLQYLLKKYPHNRDYFRLAYLLKNNFLQRLFWSRKTLLLVRIFWNLSPLGLKLKWIHFLTAYFIRSGFFTRKIPLPLFLDPLKIK